MSEKQIALVQPDDLIHWSYWHRKRNGLRLTCCIRHVPEELVAKDPDDVTCPACRRYLRLEG